MLYKSSITTEMFGLTHHTQDVLQSIQNTSAYLLYRLKPLHHISSCPQDLHQLPACYHTLYKLCTLTCTIHYGKSSMYIGKQIRLHFTNTTNYITVCLKTKFGERASLRLHLHRKHYQTNSQILRLSTC